MYIVRRNDLNNETENDDFLLSKFPVENCDV